MKRLTVRVTGRVQGVGFRDYVQRKARQLGLRGYVRNLDDGSVETVAEGEENPLRELHALVRRGPAGSRVDSATDSWGEAEGGFDGFRVRH